MFHNTIRKTVATAATALIALGAILGVASPALAHDELVGIDLVADPSDGRVEAVKLSYSNSIVEVGTEILVTGPDGASAISSAPEVAGPDVTQALNADLPRGSYTVAWRVVSSDGHPIEGGFVFFVTDQGTADPNDIAAIEADERGLDAAADTSGFPVIGIVGISALAALAVAGAVVAILVGKKRRAQAFGAPQSDSEDES
ncbi:copper resistance protein CopC [Leucobacter insecticola]|uniref:Copper resistance protein CopC n=1 Tax=Leucobacter insecticola TaxID=2714934 RepID=A0A6G8FKJ6_9MICO|nr:copper resistance CopC family protein [Leucobacter insecticola]QIM16887.1 copper resistance protein CopC [Leucobacter insecticola]